MKVHIKYFASIREGLGQGTESLDTTASNLALSDGAEVAFFPPVTGG